MKHTAPPWEAEDEHRPNHETYQIHNGNEIIAHNVSAQNMPLIIAAPELLKALEDIVIWENKITIKDESGEYMSSKTNLFEAAIKIIQKAKGL